MFGLAWETGCLLLPLMPLEVACVGVESFPLLLQLQLQLQLDTGNHCGGGGGDSSSSTNGDGGGESSSSCRRHPSDRKRGQ